MSAPVLHSQFNSLVAQLPESFTELWGAGESCTAESYAEGAHIHDHQVTERNYRSIATGLHAGASANGPVAAVASLNAPSRVRRVGQRQSAGKKRRPSNPVVDFGSQGNIRVNSSRGVAGGFDKSSTRGAVEFRVTAKIASMAVALGIVLGTFGSLVFLGGEDAAEYPAPRLAVSHLN